MFNNLQAEIARKGMNNAEFASIIKMNSRTFNRKLAGKSEFHRNEMVAIKKAIGSNCTFVYLFDLDAEEVKENKINY